MKKSSLLLAVLVFLGCNNDLTEEIPTVEDNIVATRSIGDAPEYYYWYHGKKIPLTVNENKSFVLTETAQFEQASRSTILTGSRIKGTRTMNGYSSLSIERSGKSAKEKTYFTSMILENAGLKTIDIEDVVYVAPYFTESNGEEVGITNVLSVRLEGDEDLAKLEKLAEEYNLIMLGRNQFDRSIYYLSCTKDSKGNALEMANLLYESGAFEYAQPEFLIKLKPATDDQHYNNQWYLYNSSNPSFDINYLETMNAFSFPNIDNIVVAVVDSGIKTDHEDLPLHSVSFDAYASAPALNYYPT